MALRSEIGGGKAPEVNQVVLETLAWVKEYVVALNLCPWASESQSHMGVRVVGGTEEGSVVEALVRNSIELVRDGHERTRLIALPDFGLDFAAFLNVVSLFEQVMQDESLRLDDRLQIATFHPQFIFADESGASNDGASQYTNRSPHPVVHLLRVTDVAAAIKAYGGDAAVERVWRANVEKMCQLGQPAAQALLDGITSDRSRFNVPE